MRSRTDGRGLPGSSSQGVGAATHMLSSSKEDVRTQEKYHTLADTYTYTLP